MGLQKKIDAAHKKCVSYISSYVASSVVANLVPLPGVGVTADVGITVKMVTDFQAMFEEEIPGEALADQIVDRLLSQIEKQCKKQAKKIVKKKIKQKLTQIMAKQGVQKMLSTAIKRA